MVNSPKSRSQIGVKISKRLTVINMFSSLAVHLLSLSVLIWLQQYLLKRISIEEYSLLPLVYSLMAFVPILSSLFSAGTGRYLIEAYAKGDSAEVTRVFSSIFPFLISMAIMIGVLGTIISLDIGNILHIPSGREKEASMMFLMLILGLMVNICTLPYGSAFEMRQKYVLRSFLNLGLELFRILLLFCFLFFIATKVIMVVMASVIANLVGVFITVFVSKKLVPYLRLDIQSFNWAVSKKIIGFGSWSTIGAIAQKIKSSADPILLNIFATPFDLTVFHVGSMVPRRFENALPIFLGPVQPSLIAFAARGELSRLKRAFFSLNKFLMWACLFFIVPLMIYNKEIFSLYIGPHFKLAGIILFLLFIPELVKLSVQLVWRVAHALAKIKLLVTINLLAQILNFGLTILFLSKYKLGAYGSALATCLVMVLNVVFFLLPFSLKLVKATFGEWLKFTFLPGIVPTIVGASLWWLLKLQMETLSLKTLLANLALGAAAYLLAAFMMLYQTEKIWFHAMLARVKVGVWEPDGKR